MIFSGLPFSIRYQTWGDPKHTPLLFFHGFPGSHIQAQGLSRLIDTYPFFLISSDRPGYGETSGEGSHLQYLDGLAALLDHHSIKDFHILDVSGGSPWAHMMASRFADRVRSLSIVCGLVTYNSETKSYFTPVQQKGMMIGRWMPTPAALWMIGRAFQDFNPEERLQNFFKLLDSSDQNIFADPTRRSLLLNSMSEARRQGGKGIVFDARLYHQDWLKKHCDPAALRKIPTRYYHGQRDKLLNHGMSEWMHQRHGQSTLKLFIEEGHYSLPFQRAQEILSEIH
jgi:pimeloyl-ACP methyl ester carboxylesterase